MRAKSRPGAGLPQSIDAGLGMGRLRARNLKRKNLLHNITERDIKPLKMAKNEKIVPKRTKDLTGYNNLYIMKSKSPSSGGMKGSWSSWMTPLAPVTHSNQCYLTRVQSTGQ